MLHVDAGATGAALRPSDSAPGSLSWIIGRGNMFSPHSYCRLIVVLSIFLLGCSGNKHLPKAPFVPVTKLESEFGPLITAANHPTANQLGTGTPVGLFRDSDGTIWGLPLSVTAEGKVLGCVPSENPYCALH